MEDVLKKAHAKIVNSSDHYIAQTLAIKSQDPEVLRKLAIHEDRFVRHAVGINPHTPHELLDHMWQNDPDPQVRGGVAQNPAAKSEMLERMAHESMKQVNMNYYVAVGVSKHKSTPEKALHALSDHVATEVRHNVASHLNTTTETLRAMSRQYHDYRGVTSAALMNLKNRGINEAYHNPLIKEKTVKKIKDEGGNYVGSGIYHKAGGDDAGFITPTGQRSNLHRDLGFHNYGGVAPGLARDPREMVGIGLENTDNPEAKATLQGLRNIAQRGEEIKADQREYVSEMHKHLLHNVEEPDDDTMWAVQTYTADSTSINKNLHLRAQGQMHKYHSIEDQKRDDTVIEMLDKFTAKGKTRKPMALYTGLSRDPTEHFNTSHKIIRIPRFLSTSIDSYKARDFARTQTKGRAHESHMLKINLPAGAPGQYIDHLTQEPGEREFLLPRDSHLRFREKYRDYHNPDLHVWEVDYLHHRSSKKLDEAKLSPSGWKEWDKEAELVHANEENFNRTQPAISQEQSSMIYTYTNDSYSLNKPLYHGKELGPKWGKISKDLSKMINSHSVKEPTSVFTGVSFDPDEKQQALLTKRIHLPAFTSATLSPHRAERFAWVQYHRKPNLKDMHVLHIDLPEGHPATYLGDHSNYPSEREVLLDKGLTLRVKGKRTFNPRSQMSGEEWLAPLQKGAKLHVWHCVPVKGKSK